MSKKFIITGRIGRRAKTMHEFHLYMFEMPLCIDILSSYEGTSYAIAQREDVHTTQVILCEGSLFEKGYRIFIHVNRAKPLEKHELTLGECEGTTRQIRRSHNLYRLLLSGEFDWYKEEDKK